MYLDLERRADVAQLGIRYIEHTLRRLNAVGRDGPILKELGVLPSSTKELYRVLLEDCQRSRTGADLAALKSFFAWLAYSRRPLSVGLATRLLNHIAKESTIVVDEEIEHRSARYGWREPSQCHTSQHQRHWSPIPEPASRYLTITQHDEKLTITVGSCDSLTPPGTARK